MCTNGEYAPWQLRMLKVLHDELMEQLREAETIVSALVEAESPRAGGVALRELSGLLQWEAMATSETQLYHTTAKCLRCWSPVPNDPDYHFCDACKADDPDWPQHLAARAEEARLEQELLRVQRARQAAPNTNAG